MYVSVCVCVCMYVRCGGKVYRKDNTEALCTSPLSLTSGLGFTTDVTDCSKLLLSLPAVCHLKTGK